MPLVVGAIAALSARHDYRWAWMALASLLGVGAVMMLNRPGLFDRRGVMSRSAIAVLVGSILAACTARLLGATAIAGIWPVAIALSLFWTASFALRALAHGAAQTAA